MPGREVALMKSALYVEAAGKGFRERPARAGRGEGGQEPVCQAVLQPSAGCAPPGSAR